MSTKLFETLKGTAVGNELVAYLRTLEAEIYDSRNWEPGMTRETAELAAKPIRKFINNVTIQAEQKDVTVNQCE